MIDTSYIATTNYGAYKCFEKNKTRISARKTNKNDITVAGSRSHGNEKQRSFMSSLKNATILSINMLKNVATVKIRNLCNSGFLAAGGAQGPK